MTNPLLAEWTTPFGMPPFALISAGDFKGAFDAAMGEARSNLNNIATDPAPATFANTIEAMERADRMLDRVAAVFFNLTSADTNDELEALQRDISPRLAAFHSETMTNRELFARVDALDSATEDAGLSEEQARVLELYDRMFVRAGARLEGDARGRFGDIMQRLAVLGTDFSQNVMADERTWFMALEENDLKGLPGSLVSATAQAAAPPVSDTEFGLPSNAVTSARSSASMQRSSTPRGTSVASRLAAAMAASRAARSSSVFLGMRIAASTALNASVSRSTAARNQSFSAWASRPADCIAGRVSSIPTFANVSDATATRTGSHWSFTA